MATVLPDDRAGRVAEVKRRFKAGESPRQIGHSAGIPTWQVRELITAPVKKPRPLTHGSQYRYSKGCRCESCAEAHRVHKERHAAKARERHAEGDLSSGMGLDAALKFQRACREMHGVGTRLSRIAGTSRWLVEHDPQGCGCGLTAHPDRPRGGMEKVRAA
jgi:hypothetical protein